MEYHREWPGHANLAVGSRHLLGSLATLWSQRAARSSPWLVFLGHDRCLVSLMNSFQASPSAQPPLQVLAMIGTDLSYTTLPVARLMKDSNFFCPLHSLFLPSQPCA